MAKDFSVMKPREVEAYFKQLLLSTFGDAVENQSDINAKHGSYNVWFMLDDEQFRFHFKKKTAGRVAKAIRALKAA